MYKIGSTVESYYVCRDDGRRVIANFPFGDDKEAALGKAHDWIKYLNLTLKQLPYSYDLSYDIKDKEHLLHEYRKNAEQNHRFREIANEEMPSLLTEFDRIDKEIQHES